MHLGVAAGTTQFALEHFGYNLADFRIPDERGWVASNEIIAANEDDALKTALPLEDMLAVLELVNPKARVSTDPGRYICNYVYFHSLQWVKTQREAGPSGDSDGHLDVREDKKANLGTIAAHSIVCVCVCVCFSFHSTLRCSCTCRNSRRFRWTTKCSSCVV